MSDGPFEWVGRLYEGVRPVLLALLVKKRVDRATAEDMVQECYLTFNEKLQEGMFQDVNADNWFADHKYRPMVSWWYRVANNLLLNHRRKWRRHVQPDESNWDNLIAACGEVVGKNRFTVKLINHALERCKEKHRWLLIQHYLNGRSIRELAQELRIPEGTVKSRLAAARAALKKLLTEGENFDDSG